MAFRFLVQRRKEVLTFFGVIVLFSLVYFLQKGYDTHQKKLTEKTGLRSYILPENLLPYLHLGFRNLLADYYWISIIQNSGLSGTDRQLFLKYHYNIATLDKTFTYPYSFAILWLPTKKLPGSLEAVVPLAERGMKNNPDNWEIPYYLAFQYQIIEREFEKTGTYLRIAAEKETVPLMVESAYRGYLKRITRDEDFSEELLKVAYETAGSPSLKKLAGDQLLVIYVQKALQKGINDYRKVYGFYPKNIETLFEARIAVLPEGYNDIFAITYERVSGSVNVVLR